MHCQRCLMDLPMGARGCPRCGASLPAQRTSATSWVILLLLLCLVPAVGWAGWTRWASSRRAERGDGSNPGANPPTGGAGGAAPTPNVTPVLARNVVVLDNATAATATVTPDSVAVPVAARALYPTLGPGIILASGFGTGFLRRVTNSTVDLGPLGPEVRMNTVPASLAEAVTEGSFHWTHAIPEVRYELGGTRLLGNDSANVSLSRGHFVFSPTVTIDGLIRNHTLEHLEVVIGGPLDAEIVAGLQAQAAVSSRREIRFVELSAPPIPFMLGPLPVVVTATAGLGAHAELEADANASLEFGLATNRPFTVGVHYEGGRATLIGDHTPDIHPVGPRVECGGRVRATAGLIEDFQLRLYGVIGPYVRAEPYVGLDAQAQLSALPTWSARIGARGRVGVNLTLFGAIQLADLTLYDLGNAEYVFNNRR